MKPLLALFIAGLASTAFGQSLSFEYGMDDYETQLALPPRFGEGEFTMEFSILLDGSYPVGSCSGARLMNWCSEDPQPFSSYDWWFRGNFLLDGHKNNDTANGSFSLQIYGGGRLRWLMGDGQLRAVQAWPASSTDSLLDGRWHKVTLVRRYDDDGGASLEMYIDGELIDSSAASQVNMRPWWNNWSGFPNGQEGWFWGIEKQVATGAISNYEDFKGLLDDRKFYDRAKSASEIAGEYRDLVGVMRQSEGSGSQTCDALTSICTNLTSVAWSANDAPETYAGGSSPPAGPACDNGVDDDGDGAVDMNDPDCSSAQDDDESGGSSEIRRVTFDQAFDAYPWLDMSGWLRDTGAFAGNPGPTAYPENFAAFPGESASFAFTTPQVLRSLDIATRESGDITIATEYESVVLPATANQPDTLQTGFTQPASTVTINYVSGAFGIDNIVSEE